MALSDDGGGRSSFNSSEVDVESGILDYEVAEFYKPSRAVTGLRAIDLVPLLRERLALLSGGRDRRGGPIMCFPSWGQVQERQQVALGDMLLLVRYLSYLPEERVKTLGFTVVVDMRGSTWTYVKPILKVLEEGLKDNVDIVYMIKPENFLQKQKANLAAGKYSFELRVVSVDNLFREIDPSQLTQEFEGSLPYNNEEWIQLRCRLEEFFTLAHDMSDKLATLFRALDRRDTPETLVEAKQRLDELRSMRNKVIQAPVKMLDLEAARLSQWLRQGCESGPHGAYLGTSWVCMNPDFQSLTPSVAECIQRLYELRSRVAEKWESQRGYLEQTYQLRLFEEDAMRMSEWLRSQRHLFVTSYNDIGNGAVVAEEMAAEHSAFLHNCTSVRAQIGRLTTVANKLAAAGHFASAEISKRACELEKEWSSLSAALDDRSRVLQLSSTFFRRAEDYLIAARSYQSCLSTRLASHEETPQQVERALQNLMHLIDEETAAYDSVCFAGKPLITHLQSPHNQLLTQIDYSAGMQYVMRKIQELLSTHRGLEALVIEQRRTSHQRLAAFHFRADCAQVLSWLDEHGDPFLARQTAVGRSLVRAEQLYNAHMQFEQVAANTEGNAERLCQAAEEVAATAPDAASILSDADTLGRRIMRFTALKVRRRNALDLAVGFYHHTREMLDSLSEIRASVAHGLTSAMPNTLSSAEEMCEDWRQRRESIAMFGERLNQEGQALLGIKLEAEDAHHIRAVLSQISQDEEAVENLAAQYQLRLDLCLQLRLFEADCSAAHVGLAELPQDLPHCGEMNMDQLEETTAMLTAATGAAEEVLHKGSELATAFESVGVTFVTLDNEEALGRVTRLLTELAAAAAEEDERRIGYASELDWRRCQTEAKQVSQWIRNGEKMLMAASMTLPATLSESEIARQEHEQFQEALKQTHASAFAVMAHLESFREGHSRTLEARKLEEELQSRWQRLVGSAEERHKLITAAGNWFKTADQVSSVLGSLEKEYRREEDPCGGYGKSINDVSDLLTKHGEQKEAFLKACILARRTADLFLKYLQRAGGSNQACRAGQVVSAVREALQLLMQAEGALIAAWTTRRRRLDQCQEYALFKESAEHILKLIEELNVHNDGAAAAASSGQISPQPPRVGVTNVNDHVKIFITCAEKFTQQYHLHAHDFRRLRHLVESKINREQTPPSVVVSSTANHSTQPTSASAAAATAEPKDHKKEEQLRLNRRRDNILHELINTEKQYLGHLETCLARYRGALRQPPTAELHVPVALRGKEHIIFGNMDQILAFHRDVFLRELERYHESLLPEDVGHCFVNFGENMADLYVNYCVNTPDSQKLQEQEFSMGFFEQVQAVLHLSEPLQSYLIKPVQRITKYQLLLKELLDCCEGEGELREGLDTMLAVPKKANDALHLSLLEEMPEDVHIGDILLQEHFTVWEPKQIIKKGRERHVFLFDLGIVFAKTISGSSGGAHQRYVYRGHVWLAECWITEHVEGDQCKFCIWQGRVPNVVRDEHRVGIMLRADSLDTKQQWVRALRETMQERAFVSTLYHGSRISDSSLSTLSEATLQENYRDSDSGISLSVGQTVELVELQGEWATVRTGTQGQEAVVPAQILKRPPNSGSGNNNRSEAASRRTTSFRKWLPNRKKSNIHNIGGGSSMFKRNSKSELSVEVAVVSSVAAVLNTPVTDMLDNVSEESVDVELPPPMVELSVFDNVPCNEVADAATDPGQALVDRVYGAGDNADNLPVSLSICPASTAVAAAVAVDNDKENDSETAGEDDVTDLDDAADVADSYCNRCEDTICFCQDFRNPYYDESDANPSLTDADEATTATYTKNSEAGSKHCGVEQQQVSCVAVAAHVEEANGDDETSKIDLANVNGEKEESNDERNEKITDVEEAVHAHTQLVHLPAGRRFPPIMELLESERSYVARLTSVQQRYVTLIDSEPYSFETAMPEDLKSKWRILWGNWSALLELHRGLLHKMEAAFESDPDSMPRCFVPAERRIRALYCKYCENHRKAAHVAEQHRLFFEYLRQQIGDKDVITSHIMQPVQRIMRYQLPLLEIVKGCGKDDLSAERTAEWQRMLDVMKEIPKDTECIMEASRIDGFEGNITALGKIRIKGTLRVASIIEGNKEPLKFLDRKIFLFDQMMLVTEEKKVGRSKDQFSEMASVYIFKNKVKVNNMRFVSHHTTTTMIAGENVAANDEANELRFAIRDTAPRRSASDEANPNLYVMETTDLSIRNQWVAHLKELEKMQQDFLKQLQNPRQGCDGLLDSSSTLGSSLSTDSLGGDHKKAAADNSKKQKNLSLRLSKVRSKTTSLQPSSSSDNQSSEKRSSCSFVETSDVSPSDSTTATIGKSSAIPLNSPPAHLHVHAEIAADVDASCGGGAKSKKSSGLFSGFFGTKSKKVKPPHVGVAATSTASSDSHPPVMASSITLDANIKYPANLMESNS